MFLVIFALQHVVILTYNIRDPRLIFSSYKLSLQLHQWATVLHYTVPILLSTSTTPIGHRPLYFLYVLTVPILNPISTTPIGHRPLYFLYVLTVPILNPISTTPIGHRPLSSLLSESISVRFLIKHRLEFR